MRSVDMADLIARAQSTPGPQSFKDWIARLAADADGVDMTDGDSLFNLRAGVATLLERAQRWNLHVGRGEECDMDLLRAKIALLLIERRCEELRDCQP